MYEVFEELLKKHNITAYQVAKATGVSTATLTSWKQGKYTPKTEKLTKIATYLGVTVDYLMGNTDNTEKKPVLEDELKTKNVKFIGRDGTVKFKRLTPEMISMLEQLPDSDEDL